MRQPGVPGEDDPVGLQVDAGGVGGPRRAVGEPQPGAVARDDEQGVGEENDRSAVEGRRGARRRRRGHGGQHPGGQPGGERAHQWGGRFGVRGPGVGAPGGRGKFPGTFPGRKGFGLNGVGIAPGAAGADDASRAVVAPVVDGVPDELRVRLVDVELRRRVLEAVLADLLGLPRAAGDAVIEHRPRGEPRDGAVVRRVDPVHQDRLRIPLAHVGADVDLRVQRRRRGDLDDEGDGDFAAGEAGPRRELRVRFRRRLRDREGAGLRVGGVGREPAPGQIELGHVVRRRIEDRPCEQARRRLERRRPSAVVRGDFERRRELERIAGREEDVAAAEVEQLAGEAQERARRRRRGGRLGGARDEPARTRRRPRGERRHDDGDRRRRRSRHEGARLRPGRDRLRQRGQRGCEQRARGDDGDEGAHHGVNWM